MNEKHFTSTIKLAMQIEVKKIFILKINYKRK